MTSKLFSNLARRWQLGQILDPFVNDQIRVELESAGISIIPLSGPQQKFTEVPYAMIGALGSQKMVNEYLKMTRLLDSESIDSLCENLEFVFVRRWSYWSVTGYVPLDTAVKMYRDPIGKRDVRVAGHCGCPPPRRVDSPQVGCRTGSSNQLPYRQPRRLESVRQKRRRRQTGERPSNRRSFANNAIIC